MSLWRTPCDTFVTSLKKNHPKSTQTLHVCHRTAAPFTPLAPPPQLIGIYRQSHVSCLCHVLLHLQGVVWLVLLRGRGGVLGHPTPSSVRSAPRRSRDCFHCWTPLWSPSCASWPLHNSFGRRPLSHRDGTRSDVGSVSWSGSSEPGCMTCA